MISLRIDDNCYDIMNQEADRESSKNNNWLLTFSMKIFLDISDLLNFCDF